MRLKKRSPRRLAALLFTTLAAGCARPAKPAFVHLAEARRLTTQMRVELSKASDASDRAVLADTDQQSVAFAREAQAGSSALTESLAPLADHLTELGHPAETGLLADFRQRLERYQTMDRQILALAVENTNLKAQQLSFGPVRQAADAFCTALDRAAAAGPVAARCRAGDLAARAQLAVREIQILQAPHIAEAQDAEMDRLEKDMAAREASARAALATMETAVGAGGKPHLEAARTALDRFDALSHQLIALSRRNTNVRSLELALREKPPLTAACDESLVALQDALAREGFSGTR